MYRSPSEKLVKAMFDLVLESDVVKDNPVYRDYASKTAMYYAEDDGTINAYASKHERHRDHNYEFKIQMFAGLCDYMTVMGFAFTDFIMNRNEDKLVKDFIAINKIAKGGTFNEEQVINFIATNARQGNAEKMNQLKHEALSYGAGSILSVLGHELGHICLHHVECSDSTLDVTRNNEREADLFACNVVATTPFSQYMYLGSLITEIAFMFMRTSEDYEHDPTTHPHATERVMNMYNSFEVKLREYGITRSLIERLIKHVG